MRKHLIPFFQVWANGKLWGQYLTKEHATEVIERLRRKGQTVTLREGWHTP